jgi:hypothetical protein
MQRIFQPDTLSDHDGEVIEVTDTYDLPGVGTVHDIRFSDDHEIPAVRDSDVPFFD